MMYGGNYVRYNVDNKLRDNSHTYVHTQLKD